MHASSDEPLPLRTSSAHQNLVAVLASKLTLADGRAYDQFVATAPAGHYTQTRAWARVATAGRPFKPLYFLAHRGGMVVGAGLVLRTRFGVVPLPAAQLERGPVCAKPEDLPEVLAALRYCCLARGILRLSVMPYWTGDGRAKAETVLTAAGFADCQRFSGRHVRTLRFDLTALDAEKPWNASFLSKVRQNIGRASRAGATVRPGRREDLKVFQAMQASLLAQEGKKSPPDTWYEALGDYFLGPGAAMFVCDFEGAPVSVIFITLHNGIATYALGATSGHLLKFPKTVLPMAEAILWARQAGAHTFDMGGVPMKGDPDAKRASIAEFKHSYSHTEALLVREHMRWF
jgi:lipid II:glycine glycyltransferase (peptidoglycan interpeptide bridge formation enzyme)